MAGRINSTMASGPAVACMKTLMMVFNFIFWITGIAILALGIWIKVDLYKYMELSSIYYKESPFILIGVGVVIVLVGSLGCCCTIKGNAILLYMYAAFLIVVFVVELSTGAAGFVYKGKLENGFKEGLKKALDQYGADTEISTGMDDLQKKLKCCGINSYTDWFNTTWANKQRNVPASCCKTDKTECQHTNLPVNPAQNVTVQIYTEGCYFTVLTFMQGNMGIIGGVALGISFLQLFGALFACCLAKNINRSKYEQVA